jgi:Plasmid recombination enzyme.
MVNIIKKELEIDESIKNRIDFICSFTNTEPKYFNGYLRQVELTNLVYCEPHRVIIGNITYLFFNNSDEIYKVFKHNYRMYENNQDMIYVLKGTTNLIKDVQDLYLDLFEESRIKYNDKQKRSDRKIDNYFNHISNGSKSDLACEIIIELGDMEYWEDKKELFKLRMNDVFKEQIEYLENIVSEFKVANAVAHFDEHSPHLHIVGVAFKEGTKNGMELQVGKTTVFTNESLKVIQDKMREHCIEQFNEIYSVDFKLKEKKKGRNDDIKTSEMNDYKKTEKALKKEIKMLEELKTTNIDFIKTKEDEREKIDDEIEKKKKYIHKIILKDKSSLLKENDELKESLKLREHEYRVLEEKHTTLESKVNILVNAIKKIITKLPQVIQDIIEIFFDKNQSITSYQMHQSYLEKQKELEKNKKANVYNKYNDFEPKEKEKDKEDFELGI